MHMCLGARFASCPFCAPHDAEVIREGHLTRVLVDIRPICRGHLLVVPKAHAASVAVSDERTQQAVASTALELARLLAGMWGEAGIYEHGGSPICRPRGCGGGAMHAHLHVLPLSAEVIEMWGESGSALTAGASSDHYLFQASGDSLTPQVRDLPPIVPRHFVRGLLQRALHDRGRDWLPMSADPAAHIALAEATRSDMTARGYATDESSAGLQLGVTAHAISPGEIERARALR